MKPLAREIAALFYASAFICSPVIAQSASLPNSSATALPILELQVQSTTIAVRESPNDTSLTLAQAQRGAMLSVLEQRAEWFRVQLPSGMAGWIHRVPAEYGEMNIAVFPAKGTTRIANENTGDKLPDSGPAIISARPVTSPMLVTLPAIDSTQVPPPQVNLPRESIPISDRWRLMQTLGFKFPWYDPYNQNALKGDLPVLKNLGTDYFLNVGLISDSVLEFHRVPTPVASQISINPGANNVFGNGRQSVYVENIIASLDITKGDTTFRPPDYEFRFVPVMNFNRTRVQEAGVLNADPSRGTTRNDQFLGVQELFADMHLRNVSDRYDFDSVRVGIQPFTNDFRGFLYQDSPFGMRLFGNRDNNRYQYNLAWFQRFEKDTNSGLNDVNLGLRKDQLYVANLYRQDWPFQGFTSQLSVVHNRNNEKNKYYDTNGFLRRPAVLGDLRSHSYRVTYFGYNGDGHIGAWNLSTSSYYATGNDDYSPIAHQPQKISAGFHASELSHDFNWIRVRGNFLLASGDKDPYDNKATGFDAILENPQFAGSDTSFFIRQAMPFIGGGGVGLSGRNGILPSLRSSKDEGQSNFINPGLQLIGIGADFDVKPEVRVFTNVSYLRFMNTNSLAALRNQSMPSASLGMDYSVGFHWRPFYNQNLIINGSAAVLQPGAALKALYGENQGVFYSVLFNVVATF
ncbi:MAG: SH3 domain-containing protein [Burkholderiaceae bacterium]